MIVPTYSNMLARARRHTVSASPFFAFSAQEWNRNITTSLRTTDSKDIEQTPSFTAATTPLAKQTSPIASLFHDVDQFFDKNPFFASSPKQDLFNHFWKQMDLMDDMRRGRYLSNSYFPSYDIHSDDDKVQVIIDVPGVNLSDIDVNIEQDEFLHVTGSRKTKGEGGSTKEMKFDKRFNFGKDVFDSSKVLANLANGELIITLPKLPSVKPSPENVKKIDVVNGSEELEC